jgi:hypothetical protein
LVGASINNEFQHRVPAVTPIISWLV